MDVSSAERKTSSKGACLFVSMSLVLALISGCSSHDGEAARATGSGPVDESGSVDESGWKSQAVVSLGPVGWSVLASKATSIETAATVLFRELLGDAVPVEATPGLQGEPPTYVYLSIKDGPTLQTAWLEDRRTDSEISQAGSARWDWQMVQAGPAFRMTDSEAYLTPLQPYEMTESGVTLPLDQNVSAATLFVREGATIFSRAVTEAELEAGVAQLGPRRGARHAIYVGYDSFGRVTTLLSGNPPSP